MQCLLKLKKFDFPKNFGLNLINLNKINIIKILYNYYINIKEFILYIMMKRKAKRIFKQ